MSEANLQTNVKVQESGVRSQESELQMLALAELRESKTNPRSGWEKAGLEDLAASIGAHGIIEPILVRPVNNGTLAETPRRKDGAEEYEVVVGARRLRAAKLAGLERVPAIVRMLTDREALEIQIIENLQREDVQALDEARGYQALLTVWREEDSRRGAKAQSDAEDQKAKGKGAKGDGGDAALEAKGDSKSKIADSKPDIQHRTPETSLVARLAERVGKSASYVYQRLKLTDLARAGQKALAEGAISPGHAILLARLSAEDQKAGLEAIQERAEYGEPLTVRDLGDWIQREIHRSLDAAPWKKDDAALLPAAGACTVCPKRAGSNPELYPDLKPQTCTDGACFKAKMQAHIEKQKAEARRQEAEAKAVSRQGAESAEKAGPADSKSKISDSGSALAGLLELAESYSPETDGKGKRVHPEALKASEWSEVSKKDKKCEHLRKGIVVEGARIGQTLTVCAERTCKVHHQGARTEDDSTKRWKAEQKAERQKVERATRFHEAIFRAVLEKTEKLSRLDLDLVAERMFDRIEHDLQVHLFKLAGWEAKEEKQPYGGVYRDYEKTAAEKIPTLSEPGVARLMLGCALIGEVKGCEYSEPDTKALITLAKRRGVNVEKLRGESADPPTPKGLKRAGKEAKPAKAKAVKSPKAKAVKKESKKRPAGKAGKKRAKGWKA